MQKQLVIWKFIRDSLQSDVAIMFLYVIQSAGSSPGRRGFLMAVNANGEMEGSIGGGIMEHKFVEIAKDRLIAEEDEVSIHVQVHDKSAAINQSGMICSGEQTILMFRLREKDMDTINNIICCLERNKQGFLHLSNDEFAFDDVPGNPESPLMMDDDLEDWHYTEQLGYKNYLYIIGGGHCSLALSKFMHSLDFYICVIDDRTDLNTFEANDFAHEKKIVESYSDIQNILPAGETVYVVIMTMGYRTDDLAIRAIQHKSFKYLGVLGSAKKMQKMFNDYRNEGMNHKFLSTISAPAGLPIKSQTPEEIAISIASEIIMVKNKQSK
jgi:xanthine dehydrogenase accessory factor